MALTKVQLVDLNANELIIDLDADTSITADTDDQIDIKIAGADDFRFTANTFTALSGSSIVVPDSGLTLGSTAVTSTAAELNLLDGVSGLVQADLTKLAAVDSTAAELNIVDGGTSATSTTVADADRVVLNDNGTMVQVAVTDLSAYFDDEITAMPNLVTTAATTVGALDSGSITSGFGAIDNGTSNIRSATITAETAFVPDAANGASLGTTSLEFADLYLHDGAQILWGADQDVLLSHVADAGLTLKTSATGDDTKATLTLQTGETDIAVNDVLGQLHFQAPDEGTGTDAILVAAGISAVAEGDFSSSNNATKLSFKTAASETATEKMSLSSAGLLTIADDLVIKDGGTIGVASDADSITIASNGVVTFSQSPVFPDGSLAVVDLDIDGATDIGAGLADADLLLVDDGAGGTNRKTAMSRVKTYIADVTLTTAAQTNITSLGTLTALTVDDVAVDGKVITMTGSTDDTAVLTVATNGALTLETTDTAAAAANIQITADGTFEVDATTITLDSAGDIVLDAGGNDFNFKASGTEVLRITNSSSDVVIKPTVDAKDIIFQQYDGTSILEINDGAYAKFTAAAIAPEATLTDASTVTINALTQSVSKVTLGGNRTIGLASGGVAGAFISLLIIQDGTGSRTVSWNAAYEFAADTAPTLTTTANLGDLFVFRYNGAKWLEVGRNLALTLS